MEALRAFGELKQVRRSLALYRAQPQHPAPEDFAERVRAMIEGARTLCILGAPLLGRETPYRG